MRARLLSLAIAVSALGSGCFDAPDACYDLAETLCGRLDSCGARPANVTCGDRESIEGCEAVVGVSGTYDACLAELPDFPCTNLLAGGELPEACNGALAAPASSTGPRRNVLIGGQVTIRTSTSS